MIQRVREEGKGIYHIFELGGKSTYRTEYCEKVDKKGHISILCIYNTRVTEP